MEKEVLMVTVPLEKYEGLVECAANIDALARMFASSRYVNDDEIKAILGIRVENFEEGSNE